ncbi:type I restriction-modification system endonuclease [Natranaerobius thermophilus]|uniref:Type III restriction protein res subunit n=1 Tax=Natranaerobius thermophilus (strain ATCC BAA-1301 / DSM 18059 / JW/NM-WN-LF) TaxID=457570 RepID=B2A6M4_NATTJ|nr:type I restriction-modification system endonuclease [Natranaerobius thermophilus]ACB85560.1 type III restriction protein res subunit [Natranaerobius thermophilus JW/NM-WN-LF]
MQKSNFDFLTGDWSILSELGEIAEKNLHTDPNTTIIKLRMFAETLVKFIFAVENLEEPEDQKQVSRLAILKKEDLLTDDLLDLFHTIRKIGNKAAHAGYGNIDDAKTLLRMAFRISVWFMQVYGRWDFEPPAYVEPEKIDFESLEKERERLEKIASSYEKKVKKLENELNSLRSKASRDDEKKERKTKARQLGTGLELTEAETRTIIDDKLRAVGWEADTETIRYSKGIRPEKGRNLAIAEWPVKNGSVDYALFVGMQFIGIIEAKRKSKNIQSDIEQAKQYSKRIYQVENEEISGPWNGYKVPFLFATNGRPYLKQLEHKSGIWFLDARKKTNHPRPLKDWYSPEGLTDLSKKNIEEATKELKEEPLDYLGLRYYQEEAIKAIEKGLEEGRQSLLIAMATGTGKTRMAIGLIYRLVKSRRFKRVLFLVDRNALGKQAENAFKDSKLESFNSFTEIFELQSLKAPNPNPETKVHISTVQGMMRRIYYNDPEKDKPTVDQYDCIVVDEAHRGYTLDSEMEELELYFRDHNDYVSKYRQVLDYFDAVRIGLTATPALHTVEIFGSPIYTYSYREAVVDGYLIDHEPPYQINTKLKKEGINWQVGEEVDVYDAKSGDIKKEVMEDEVEIDVSQFNKQVITESFNRTVIKELVNYIHPELEGKTLIFAANDDHADTIVRILKEELENKYGPIEDNAVMKITGSLKNPLQAIKLFQNERLPNIVVTVDLLTTGVDVPPICSLVFMRRVRSRILYEQMLGRATRRCDEIDKDHFNIFDAVEIYEALKPYTDMKPVVKKPNVPVKQLVNELEQINSTDKQKNHIDQIKAKIQRKSKHWTEEEKENFKALTGGKTVDEYIDWMKNSETEEIVNELQKSESIVNYIDENRERPQYQYISNHKDEHLSTTRGYGNAEKPEDYLEGFKQFIEENINHIPALKVVCQRPKELTREDLRKLKIELDQQGYNEKNLQAAWRDAKNEDIAADIISFIRQLTVGDALVSHEERVKNAMKRIYRMKAWPPVQKKWLERIEKQLLEEKVLGPDPEEAFEVQPFKRHGGYKQLNKIFDGQIDMIVEKINEELFNQEGRDHV